GAGGPARPAAPAQSPAPTPPSEETSRPATPAPARGAAAPRGRQSSAEAAAEKGVREAFDTLVDGIRRADAEAVMGVYWESPRLVLFNNNGTVTKTWEQARSNRESLYARVKDVKLDVRDVNVKMLGPGAAVVTCLWEQTQAADGQPERATGRLTLVFQKIGAAWKAVHAHTSPDRPDPSRLLPSERTDGATPTKP
ncbi:MAG TPA: nuclear transport factor 2 family protein, partial [Pyrinomonadaceae bacterium]|nr:nuclear transport factor 2 family protein [Pyrinomonadaceae bacterium]